MRTFFIIFGFAAVATLSVLGFRGGTTTIAPIEIFPDMDRQSRYKSQGESEFFADGRSDRLPVPGTVGQGHFADDLHLAYGKDEAGDYVRGFPAIVSREMMERGAERYAIYCAPCHGANGSGKGITTNYGMAAVADLHVERLVTMSEGEIFDVITNGRGLMGSYGAQVPAEDRWNIIAYVRVLQRAHLGSVKDVPADHRADLGL